MGGLEMLAAQVTREMPKRALEVRARLESVPGGATEGGREVMIQVSQPLGPGEGLLLLFHGSMQLTPLRQSDQGVLLSFPRELHGTPYRILRTPERVPESGFHGQSLPPRTLQTGASRSHVFVDGWQDGRGRSEFSGPELGERRMVFWTETSRRVSEPRRVQIHLPKAYAESPSRRFPLVLVLDGQNALCSQEAYGGLSWSLDRQADRMELEGGTPCVLVAVDHGGIHRVHEYTPAWDSSCGLGGGAYQHLDFLLNEVLPQVRQRVRLLPGPATLLGSSLAGLFGLWAALEHPAAFRRVAAVSPMTDWANDSILRGRLGEGDRPQVWLDMGSRETPISRWKLQAARRLLERHGWREGVDLSANFIPGGEHHEVAWADRAGEILRFLLDGPEGER